MITYTKLKSGAWGLRGDALTLCEGDTVKVSKRDGETKTEKVGRILWSDGDVSIASIYGKDGSSRKSAKLCRRCGGKIDDRVNDHDDGICYDCMDDHDRWDDM